MTGRPTFPEDNPNHPDHNPAVAAAWAARNTAQEYRAAMNTVLNAASDYAEVCIADGSLTDEEISGIMLSVAKLS